MYKDDISQNELALLLIDSFGDNTGRSRKEKQKSKNLAKRIAERFMKCKILAVEILKDNSKIEPFLLKIEQKIADIPGYGEKLKYVPEMILLIRSYVSGEYDDISLAEIILILASLIYYISPFQIVPNKFPILDKIPIINKMIADGHLDDIAVNKVIVGLFGKDIEKYMNWLKNK